MVFAVGGVSFNCEFEVRSVVGGDGADGVFVAEFVEFENVGFPADAPWPKTVAVTVGDQSVLGRVC